MAKISTFILAAALLLVLSCSNPMTVDTGSSNAQYARQYNAAQTCCDTVTVTPSATGTVRWLPEMGILEMAPVCDDIQASYFCTTPDNREIRRGFAEFALPAHSGRVMSARLVFTDNHAIISEPRPPDEYVLSHYPADLSIDTADFHRPTIKVASFYVDLNEGQKTYTIDIIRSLVTPSESNDCRRIGFRFALRNDENAQSGIGSEFGSEYNNPPRIIIVYRAH